MIVPIPRGPEPWSCALALRDAIRVWGEYSPGLLLLLGASASKMVYRGLSPWSYWNLN